MSSKFMAPDHTASKSELALGEGDMASCAAYAAYVGGTSRYFRVNLEAFQVYPGFARSWPYVV